MGSIQTTLLSMPMVQSLYAPREIPQQYSVYQFSQTEFFDGIGIVISIVTLSQKMEPIALFVSRIFRQTHPVT
jgi:hypothetical protein